MKTITCLLMFLCLAPLQRSAPAQSPPNLVLIMTDDQGWGETGYYGHPVLKTPNLDAMAAGGLRLDRFYAAGPVCSPTRASIMTGRSHNRTGVPDHGYALRLQEKTLAQALNDAGYATGHFGKWHLNGFQGGGVPVLKDDPYGPSGHGFESWVSATNFIDMDAWLGSEAGFQKFKGDSSAIIVGEALRFIDAAQAQQRPFFAVIWDGSPHEPFHASAADIAGFENLNENSRHHYGELVAFDRSIGVLRQALRDRGLAGNTIVWYCSDNGGLPLSRVKPATTGGLRGNKGDVYEGGIRVPCIIEWPGTIPPRISDYPASTMDMFPTIAALLGLPQSGLLQPIDGDNLVPLFATEPAPRTKPIPFRYLKKGAWIDNHEKLVTTDFEKGRWELYDLKADPQEAHDLSAEKPEVLARLKAQFLAWNATVDASVRGEDYPEGQVAADHRKERVRWVEAPAYQAYLNELLVFEQNRSIR